MELWSQMWPRITRPVWQGEFANPTRPPAALPVSCSEPEPRTYLTKRTKTYRTIILPVRLSPEEHAAILERAGRACLPPSTYVRHAALAAPLVVRSFVSLAPEDLGQLKRLGNLLNQIARAGWRGRFTRQTEELLAAVLLELKISLRGLSRPVTPP